MVPRPVAHPPSTTWRLGKRSSTVPSRNPSPNLPTKKNYFLVSSRKALLHQSNLRTYGFEHCNLISIEKTKQNEKWNNDKLFKQNKKRAKQLCFMTNKCFLVFGKHAKFPEKTKSTNTHTSEKSQSQIGNQKKQNETNLC